MNRNPFILKNVHPETSLVWGYISYTIAGVLILSLPWFRVVSIGFLDNLFISVSAISTTGLA
ncbi:MAG: hypothetical protein JXR86_13160, partial [Spirochaetales bacterium]|nr:hypothetical protein [Spirochaetales bacterium]